uniref:Uncharacterized protein LOC105851389 n=1 Tax=Cicer arietinum TaxID=3827 RepID=A0A1S3DWN4_CICAR|nr:uncharacterized protein LOC105851389 [Cicer arietinum]
MGKLNYFLGLHIKQLKHGIFTNQAKYCKELLKRFEMEKCKEIVTPMGSRTYVDKDESGCKTEHKSTSDTCHILGNALVSWSYKKQACVVRSTAEAEDIAAGSCSAHILLLKQQLYDYGLDLGCVPLRCDNTSNIEVTFMDTHNQLADIFTKPLPKDSFYKIRRELDILNENDL